jgi:hypothetical protein
LSGICNINSQASRAAAGSHKRVYREINHGTKCRAPSIKVGLWDIGERVQSNAVVLAAEGIKAGIATRAEGWMWSARAESFFFPSLEVTTVATTTAPSFKPEASNKSLQASDVDKAGAIT